jgi:hypothetical protein
MTASEFKDRVARPCTFYHQGCSIVRKHDILKVRLLTILHKVQQLHCSTAEYVFRRGVRLSRDRIDQGFPVSVGPGPRD